MADVEYNHQPVSGWLQAGSAAGGLALLGQVMGRACGNGGIVGALTGNNCGYAVPNNFCGEYPFGMAQYMAQMESKLGKVEAEKYADKGIVEAYKQSEQNLNNFATKIDAAISALNNEACNTRIENAKLNGRVDTLEAKLQCCCEKQDLREQVVLGKINELGLATTGQINTLNQTISCLSNTVGQVTKTVIPNTSVCPGWGNVTITPASGSAAA